MKIAVPISGGQLNAHFGHTEKFAMVEVDKDEKKVLNIEMLTPPEHKPGVYPKWVKEQGADLVISGGMGERARELFIQMGVDVLTGAPSDTPESVVKAYLDGKLVLSEDKCDHHH